MAVGGIVGLIILIIDIIVIIGILTSTASAGYKVLWTLVIILLPVIGLILYFLLGHSHAVA